MTFLDLRNQLPAHRSLVPDIDLPIIRICHGRFPQPCGLAQCPRGEWLRRVEHVVRLIVGVPDPGIVATQGFPAIRLAVWPIVDPATGVVAGLDPFAGRRVHEGVEEVGFSDDDLDDLLIADFCEVAHAV